MRYAAVSTVLSAVFAALVTVSPGHAEPSGNVDVASYKVAVGPVILEGVADNASGITYCGTTKSLFCVLNGPTHVLELDPRGVVKRRITLDGFNDTEGIVWIKDNVFAVIEERRRMLVEFRLEAETTAVAYAGCRKTLIDKTPAGNSGLEGLARDSKSGLFYILKEKDPRKIYAVKLSAEAARPEISFPWDAEKQNLGLRDLSGLHLDAATGHLLILSQESGEIVETTRDGTEVSRLKLKAGNAGLSESPAKAEGVCLDTDGNLYVCGEPNVFYVFRKRGSL